MEKTAAAKEALAGVPSLEEMKKEAEIQLSIQRRDAIAAIDIELAKSGLTMEQKKILHQKRSQLVQVNR